MHNKTKKTTKKGVKAQQHNNNTGTCFLPISTPKSLGVHLSQQRTRVYLALLKNTISKESPSSPLVPHSHSAQIPCSGIYIRYAINRIPWCLKTQVCLNITLFLLLIFQGMLVPFHAFLPTCPKPIPRARVSEKLPLQLQVRKKKLQWIFECCLPMRSFDQLPGDDTWSALILHFLWLFPSRGQRARLIGLKSEMMPRGISLFLIFSAVSSCLLRASFVRGKLHDISRAESNSLQNNGGTRSDKALVKM